MRYYETPNLGRERLPEPTTAKEIATFLYHARMHVLDTDGYTRAVTLLSNAEWLVRLVDAKQLVEVRESDIERARR